MKKIYASISILLFVCLQSYSQSFTNGFEAATLALDGWSTTGKIVIPSTNGWCGGAATPPSVGAKCAYVSTNPVAATPYAYSTGVVDTLILYRTAAATINVNQSNIQLSFDWKCVGEGSTLLEDAFQVYIIPSAVTVNTNALSPANRVGQIFYNGQAGWQTETMCIDPMLANGGAYRVAFVWFNDGDASAATAPPAIDNVNLTIANPTAVPPCVVNNAPANGSTGVNPCSVTFLWDPSSLGTVPNCNGAGGIAATAYTLFYSATSAVGPWIQVNTNFTSLSITTLAANTQYWWYIAPRNSFNQNTTCSGAVWTFTTGPTPPVTVAPPVLEDVEGCTNWAFNNGGPNAWVRGTATANGGISSIYVSNNGGTSNVYTGTTASVIHAYNSPTGTIPYFDLVSVPSGNCVNLSFDWKAVGESSFDYLDVWIVPTVAAGYVIPASGTQITAAATPPLPSTDPGRVKIASALRGSASWATQTINLSGFIGKQFRIVFTWINDGSITGNPPAAIDNIKLLSTGVPLSDVPCTASIIPVVTPGGITLSGSNICAVNTDEPFNSTANDPSCWTNTSSTQINTVWYRFTAPSYASPCVRVWVKPSGASPLRNPQIAVYTSGNTPVTCGNGSTLTFVASSCNDDRPNCGSVGFGEEPDRSAEVQVGGLSPGNYYYIAIDGLNDLTGTFSLFVMDAGAGCVNPLPPTPGQDCALPTPVSSGCNIFVPNPGYRNFGTVCDLNAPAACLGSGEKYSAWYQINVTGAGNLMFDIVPNDYPGAPTDYDFILFRLQPGNVCDGNNTNGLCCAEMRTSPGVNVRCNYSAQQVTGLYTGGNSPPAYPGFNGAYEAPVAVAAGEQYVLMVSNFAPGAGAGFSLSFANSTCTIGAFTNGSSILWTGSVSTDWSNAANWSGCQVPTCSTPETNAIIPAGYVNPPVINGNASCRNITINAGATLTFGATAVFSVCGDYNNQGNVVAQTGSRVIFEGPNTGSYNFTDASHPVAGTQNLDGNLTGPNGFHHVDVFKSAINQEVNANQDIEIKGDMNVGIRVPTALNNTTSYFDVSGKYHKQGGHFTVYGVSPSSSIYNPGSTLEFNGSVNQNYRNNGVLNSVFLNQSAASTVTLINHTFASSYLNISTAGTLTFTQGRVISPGGANGYVNVQNNSPAAVNGGNATSYIQNALSANATLRRYYQAGATGIYEFPIGTALRGYNRLSFNITTALTPAPTYLTATFNNTVPVTPSGVWSECGITYHTAGVTPLNHGFWQISLFPTAALTGGTYNMSLYSNGHSNNAPGHGVMYSRGSNTAAGWQMNPLPMSPCFANGIAPTLRQGMSASVTFNSALPAFFAVAQSNNPLPVELLSLDATPFQKSIRVSWTTASELNNRGFYLQRSLNGVDFTSIKWIDGNGTTNQVNEYGYIDKDVKGNVVYYYRLLQVDFNGEENDSKIVAARLNQDGFVFDAKPNPYVHSTKISFELTQTSNITAEVINPLGQNVTTLIQGLQEEGVYEFDFSARKYGFANGVYTVRLIVNGTVYTKRLFEHQ